MAAATASPPVSDASVWTRLLTALRALLPHGTSPPSPLDALRADDVAYSACRVAARRALESRERDPIAVDPLAAALAGARALADAAATAVPRPRGAPRRPVDRIAVRTRWFDDELCAALRWGGAPTVRVRLDVDSATGRTTVALCAPAPLAHPPRQVVVAGAGMDARAWRLPLPPGTAVWEVDAAPVLTAKAHALAAAGAVGAPTTIHAAGGRRVDVAAAAASTAPPRRAGRHALRAASLEFVAADVGVAGWTDALAQAPTRFDRARPCIVLAEGIIMYLAGERGAAAFLTELAAIAAPGSVLLAVSVTAATAAAARARARGVGLMAAWTFGCDPDPAPLLARCGWRVVRVDTRSDMARRYTAPGRTWGFPVREASVKRVERESLFIVAVRE